MSTEARLGYGTLLQRYTGASWVTVAEQVSISGPSLSSDDVEVTNHDSPGGSKEYIPALMDTGEVSFDGNFIPSAASQTQLLADQKARTVADWRIVLPDATDVDNRTKWTFPGYIKTINFSYPTQEVMAINATMKLAGEATLSSVYSDPLTGLVVTGSDTGIASAIPALSLANTHTYSYVLANGNTTCTVTPTMATADAIYVNDVVVDTGDPSGAIPLSTGHNLITVKTVDADKSPLIYTLHVTRQLA